MPGLAVSLARSASRTTGIRSSIPPGSFPILTMRKDKRFGSSRWSLTVPLQRISGTLRQQGKEEDGRVAWRIKGRGRPLRRPGASRTSHDAGRNRAVRRGTVPGPEKWLYIIPITPLIPLIPMPPSSRAGGFRGFASFALPLRS